MKTELKKIVVAEDDFTSRELLCEMLRSWGYYVVEARDGAEALQEIEETRPDLVVCDIQMPLLDGVGLVQALRRNNNLAALPVIALTGVGTQDHQTILSAGFSTYQSKPVSGELIRWPILRVIALRK